MLKKKGVEFFINTGYLIVSKIGTSEDPLKKSQPSFSSLSASRKW